jgi:hypothetical protein
MYNALRKIRQKYLKAIAFLLGAGFLFISGCQPRNIKNTSDEEETITISDSLTQQEEVIEEDTATPEPLPPTEKPAKKQTPATTPNPATEVETPEQTRPLEPAAAYGTMPAQYRSLTTPLEKND